MIRRRPRWQWHAAALVALSAAACGPQLGNDDAIVALMHCYGRGTDAIGELRIHAASADPAQAARDAGAAIVGGCFREDASFEYWFPSRAFDQQAAPDSDAFPPDVTKVGPDAWADWVGAVFRSGHYDFTQHMLGNIRVERRGAGAQLVASLIASHFTLGPGAGAPSACADVAMGTYTLDAEHFGGVWKATRLRLTVVSFDPIFEAKPGGCRRSDATPSA